MPDPNEITHIRPLGLIAGADAPSLCGNSAARPLAGGPLAFTHVEVICKSFSGDRQRSIYPVTELDRLFAGQINPADRLCIPTPPFAGNALSGEDGRPRVMGIVNVTPDSFSDGGDYADADAAIAHGRALHAAGADIVDVGGESTRPGAAPISVEDELARVMPVVTGLAGDGITISIDTRHAIVMGAAIAGGARIVNDVSALTHDPDAMAVIAASDASVILMHMQGTPESMQQAPHYDDVVLDVYDALEARVAACAAAGIARSRICVDPGIGFGKTAPHNLALIASLAIFHGLGCAVGIGVSRKSFIDAIAGTSRPKDRLPGSLAAMLAALGQGAQIVRVHDVAETVQAVALWREAQAN
jgi:dihydropteroate synthase